MNETRAPDRSRHPPPPPAHGGARVRVLHPGGVALAERGDRLDTLLGSCVALLLSDRQRTVGVMCHIVHVTAWQERRHYDTRHGPAALARMGELLAARGFALARCQAWICGGGDMFPQRADRFPVGPANLAWARQALQAQGIAVLGESVGGPHYRKLRWTVGRDAPEIEVLPIGPQRS